MIILPAIDLYDGQAVRLYKGLYEEKTVYSERPWEVAASFYEAGATHLHLVDLNGARDGDTPNFDTVVRILETVNALHEKEQENAAGEVRPPMVTEIGGGIRSFEAAEKYLEAGVTRVILGTAAVTDDELLNALTARYGARIAVSADIKDGEVAIKGWTESGGVDVDSFFEKLEKAGVRTVICTDVSKDGAMAGTGLPLYEHLKERFGMELIASGGVSTLDDVKKLKALGVEGAIIGKALYTKSIDLKEAIEVAK